jgi:DNA-3-methyladenine glycosylase
MTEQQIRRTLENAGLALRKKYEEGSVRRPGTVHLARQRSGHEPGMSACGSPSCCTSSPENRAEDGGVVVGTVEHERTMEWIPKSSGAAGFGPRLPRSFFARPSTVVAPELLGRVLVRTLPDGTRLAARLVEVEAYEQGDPASHSYRGRPTPRTEVMYGPPGRLYVYFIYGRHFCANVATGPEGYGSAVLFRAAEPLDGFETMAANRGKDAVRLLCSGPARLAQALGINRADSGADLVSGQEFFLCAGSPVGPRATGRSTRVGINVGVEHRWRFFERGSAFVSPGKPSVDAAERRARKNEGER